MTRRSTPLLRVAPPTLEPGPVLLHQLVELSASSRPAVRTVRYAGARALAGAAVVAVIGGTTWVAGAATGPGLGAGPREQLTHESTGVATPGEAGVGTPQSDDATSAPGSSWSPELPGTRTSTKTGARSDADHRDDHARSDRGRPAEKTHEDHGHHYGTVNGLGNGHGRGHAYGHDKTPPARSSHTGAKHEGRHDNGQHKGADKGKKLGHQSSKGRGHR